MIRMFAFKYVYRNTEFALSLPADSEEDAIAKLKAMGAAEYQGEIMQTSSVQAEPLTPTPTLN